MRTSARQAVAETVDDLTDALDDEGYEEDYRREMVEEAQARLAMLLERDLLEPEKHKRWDAGARLRVKMTRGEDVRDQDEWVIEGEGETAAEAREEFEELLGAYVDDYADAVRGLQPGGGQRGR